MGRRIYFIHPGINTIDDLVKYLKLDKCSWIRNLIWDAKDPQIVIASEFIYKDRNSFNVFKKLSMNPHRILVFQGGEAVYPDLNIFDYAIVLSRKFVYDNRVFRIPPSYFYERSLLSGPFSNNICFEEALKIISSKKFCNFIYSNPYANPMRDKIFYTISKYKKVDSLGAHLNNTGILPTRSTKNWAEISIKQKSDYKFSVASENELFEGYTTEKLLTSFQAHSVPIYWGNPFVAEEFNEKAFINVHSFNTMEELFERIKEVDSNDKEWAKMVSAAWQTPEQMKTAQKEMENYLYFMEKILGSDFLPQKVVPVGTFADMYSNWFYRSYARDKNVIRNKAFSVKRKIKLYVKHYVSEREH